MPACAYDHCTSPEQSKWVCGVEPPHWYGVPRYFFASVSAASARGPAPSAVPPTGGAASTAAIRPSDGWRTPADLATGASTPSVSRAAAGLASAAATSAGGLKPGETG